MLYMFLQTGVFSKRNLNISETGFNINNNLMLP